MKRLLIYTLFHFLCLLPLLAETIVVGTVLDERTGQPIPNANVFYKGTDIGCATNGEGLFMVRTELDKKRTLIISAIGYKTQKYQIEPDQYAGIQVLMQEQNTLLQDIVVSPKDNPALGLMQRVREHRTENDISLNPTAHYDWTERKQLYISQIDQRHLRRALWKSLQSGMIMAEDSTYLLPLYQSIGTFSATAGQFTQSIPPQTQSLIFTPTDYSMLLGGIDRYLNFYRNTLTIFDKTFVSPLASYGNNHYQYYLYDSLQVASGKHYIVHIRSKNPFEPSFNGEMTIDSASLSIRHIRLSVPREVTVNYLSSLQIEQTYTADNIVAQEDLSMFFDFAIKADTSRFFPTVLLTRHSSSVNSRVEANLQPIAADTTAMDTLSHLPVIRVASFIAHIINTGNIPTGTWLEIGNIEEILHYTRYEGWHVGLPLTTNERLLKRVEFSAYIGYGFGDKALKGKGQIRALLPAERRNLLGAYYWDHYTYTDVSDLDRLQRGNTIFYGEQDFTHWLLNGIQRNTIPTTAARQRELKIWTENDITDNIETYFAVKYGRMGYFDFSKPIQDHYINYHQMPSFRYTTLQARLRVGFAEQRIDRYMNRFHTRSRYPVLFFNLEGGGFRMDDMEDDDIYARVEMMVQQNVGLGMCGHLDYTLQGGFVFGKVPYPLLKHFTANQTYTFDQYRFTLMNPYQYAANRYLLAHLCWNMEGLLFNRIPGIRYLHLRELIEMKMAWGALDGDYPMKAPFVPYIEAGAGIGNILRLGDLYAVFRLTHFEDTSTPWWAIRFRIHLGL